MKEKRRKAAEAVTHYILYCVGKCVHTGVGIIIIQIRFVRFERLRKFRQISAQNPTRYGGCVRCACTITGYGRERNSMEVNGREKRKTAATLTETSRFDIRRTSDRIVHRGAVLHCNRLFVEYGQRRNF